MKHAQLEAVSRVEIGRKTNAIRAEGKVPAVMYGFGTEPVNLTVDRNAFIKVFAQSGESTVVDLMINGATHPVLVSDVQRNPLNDFVTHIDFRRVDINRKIEASIPLVLVGESPAVKNLGGILVNALEELEVVSLPNALVHEIEVDISSLKTFDDVIHVSDIVIPAGIEVKTSSTQAVVLVQPPRSEAELASLNEAVDLDVSKVEVLTEKKEEEAPAPEKK